MKLRIFYSTILLIAGMICFSCSNEVLVDPDTGVDGDGSSENAYFSVNTVCDRLLTKASEDIGEAEEFHVEKVRVVLYDGSAGVPDDQRKVKYVFDYDIKTNYNTDNSVNTSQPWTAAKDSTLYAADANSFTTFARKVAKQDYLMLVIINPALAGGNGEHPSLGEITQEGSTLSAFKSTPATISAAHLRDKGKGGVAAGNYFLMTNHQGLVQVPESSLKSSVNDANSTPVKVSVDRAVAKVFVKKAPGFQVKKGKIDSMSWELDITNQKTYWMRMMDRKKGGDPEEDGTGRDSIYAKDPNFEGFDGTEQGEFNVVYTNDRTTAFANPLDSYQYTLENTMGTGDQGKEGVMTRVVVRAQYTPSGFNPGDSYYSFTSNDGKDYFISTEDMAFYIFTATDYQIPKEYSGLREAMNDVARAGIDISQPWFLARPFSVGKIKYYYQGYCYYQIPIKHFGGNLNPLDYGYYGVVRNNVYTVSLQSIEGPGGLTVEEGPFLSAGINIVPWGQLTDGRDLGETNESFITYKYYYEKADGSSELFATDHVFATVGLPFPTVTDEILNAHYAEIPKEAGAHAKGVVIRALTVVSADYNQNVCEIEYKRIKVPAVPDIVPARK